MGGVITFAGTRVETSLLELKWCNQRLLSIIQHFFMKPRPVTFIGKSGHQKYAYGHSPSYRWLSVIDAIRNNLNNSHAVCITSVISDVNMDSKPLLYFTPQNTLKVRYVRVINITNQEHSYLHFQGSHTPFWEWGRGL